MCKAALHYNCIERYLQDNLYVGYHISSVGEIKDDDTWTCMECNDTPDEWAVTENTTIKIRKYNLTNTNESNQTLQRNWRLIIEKLRNGIDNRFNFSDLYFENMYNCLDIDNIIKKGSNIKNKKKF